MAKKHKKRAGKPDKLKLAAARNLLFNHPLMSKSHCHEKAYKADRRAAKVKLHSNYRTDYHSDNTYDSQNTIHTGDWFYDILRIVRAGDINYNRYSLLA